MGAIGCEDEENRLRLCLKSLEHHDCPNLRTQLKDIYLGQGEQEKAEQQLAKMWEQFPDDYRTYIESIEYYSLFLDREKLSQAVEKAISCDKIVDDVYRALFVLRSLKESESGFYVQFRKSGVPIFKDPGRKKVDMEEMKMRAAVQAASEKIEFFNPVALGYLTVPQYKILYGKDLNCDYPLCKGKSLDDFVNYGLSNGTHDHKKYTAYQTVHESISSFNELERSQESIEKSAYLDYLEKKPIVNRYWREIDEVTAGTLQRSDW
jgi:hypothetical protein